MKTKLTLLIALFTSIIAFSQKKWTLQECVEHALKNNITIKQSKLAIENAKTNVKNARSNFLPTLNGSTGGNFGIGPVINQVTNSRIGSTTSLGGSLNLNTGLTVFNGFRNLNTYKQSLLGVEGSALDLEKMSNDISLNVVNGYLNILFAKENLAVAKVQSEISKNQIKRAQAQFDAGAIPKGDLLNIQSTAANDAQNIVIQENALSIALLRLTQLLQVPTNDFDVLSIEVAAPSETLLYKNSQVVYEKAVANMPEIERAKVGIERADLGIKIARSGYIPSISASAGTGTNYFYDLKNDRSQGSLLKQLENQLQYNVGLNITVPIFNGFRNDASVEQAKINRAQSEIELENQKLQLQQTIEQAYLDAKTAAKAFEAAQLSLEAQKEAFKNAQTSYEYGAMTQFDFDQVRNRLVNAESTVIRAKYDYVFKTKVLKFYFGESIVE